MSDAEAETPRADAAWGSSAAPASAVAGASSAAATAAAPASAARPPLRERQRRPTGRELANIPWLAVLDPHDRAEAEAAILVANAEPGDFVCRFGRPATYWFGLVDGLLKMSNDAASGSAHVTFTGIPPGGWFGEGTLLKHEPYRYNIEALRRSIVAGLPVATFHALLGRSIGFNRFVLNQLNERLGQFIAAREIDRLNDPDSRVARSLGALFHPVLYPGVGELLRITQQELGYLVGLSRQRVNEALHTLQREGVIRIEYGGLRVLSLERLRGWRPAHDDEAASGRATPDGARQA